MTFHTNVKSFHRTLFHSCSGVYFPTFGLSTETLICKSLDSVQIRGSMDQINSEYRHFLRIVTMSVGAIKTLDFKREMKMSQLSKIPPQNIFFSFTSEHQARYVKV